ncbi:hypothetical protein CLI92_05870 [Vandammella animalimorsus]|uniref:Uncharacterized protein n=1 Tax=Vandammella animalimorsus TaxID=2029117 RepID=A0A2A2T6E5_9BURK|nr:hypothetical protein CLI92_05870 [Vandammella animalimorsus]
MAAVALLLGYSGLNIDFFGAQGVVDRLLSFTQTLTGFYIAALAAVSSFNSPHLDRIMPSPAPTMRVKYQGGYEKVELTRRRFLTSMFAFLTASSFIFNLCAIAALVVSPAIPAPVSAWLWWPGSVWFLFLIAQMTCITFWGLYYLGERVLTPD